MWAGEGRRAESRRSVRMPGRPAGAERCEERVGGGAPVVVAPTGVAARA